MRITGALHTVPMLLVLFCVVIMLGNKPVRGFDLPPTNTGEPLTDAQRSTLESAIAIIRIGPPESISYEDVDGNLKNVACSVIAKKLLKELEKGEIEQEVQNQDLEGWEYKGQININDSLLNRAGGGQIRLVYLQELLIHEWVHKQQDGTAALARCAQCAKEVEAADAEIAYKDSSGVLPTDPEYRAAVMYQYVHYCTYWMWERDNIGRKLNGDLVVEIRQGEDGIAGQCLCYHWGDSAARTYDLGTLQCSDFRVLENYFPNGNGLALLCGFVPDMGGRLLALELSDSGVVGPFSTLDFPQYFYAIERAEFDNSWFIVDTSTTRLHRMVDTNGDLLPDLITGIFASALQFPQLTGMRSVETAIHPVFGIGLIVNPEPAHQTHVMQPYDLRRLLVDADGDHVADACFSVRRCEFMQVIPQIRSEPLAGDNSISVFGTWNHEVGVYTTDESGETLFEMLSVVSLADSIEVTCPLVRPLVAGEYIIPVDLVSGERSGVPTQIMFPTPGALVMRFDPEFGILQLTWESVPGAAIYALFASDDGVEYYDTGIRSGTNQLVIPLPPLERQFYRVTAEQ